MRRSTGRAAYGLVATNAPGERPALILQGHVDVVPPGDLSRWSADPFAPAVRNGRVIGRGACDMKGGVVAILAAVEEVLGADGDVPPFAVHFVVGEEDGGLGAYATLDRGHTGDACLIPEPTDLRLITANAGSLTFRIEVPGLATHGSTRYEGHSAIDAYLPIHAALAELERRRNADPEPLLADYPDRVPAVGRPDLRRRLGQQCARPRRGRGSLRAAGRRGPGRRSGRTGGGREPRRRRSTRT